MLETIMYDVIGNSHILVELRFGLFIGLVLFLFLYHHLSYLGKLRRHCDIDAKIISLMRHIKLLRGTF